MNRSICKAKEDRLVTYSGLKSIEWYKDGIPQRYCYGYRDATNEELFEVCRDCRNNVIYAQEDLDNYKGGGQG
jgi:hypothetical protein